MYRRMNTEKSLVNNVVQIIRIIGFGLELWSMLISASMLVVLYSFNNVGNW